MGDLSSWQSKSNGVLVRLILYSKRSPPSRQGGTQAIYGEELPSAYSVPKGRIFRTWLSENIGAVTTLVLTGSASNRPKFVVCEPRGLPPQ
jgi:hypothetical protein